MRILKLHIKNINSLKGVFNIDFDSGALQHTGIFAITGATGAGKTTILDAITLALYGKVARNKDIKEVLSHGTTESHAELVFEVFDKQYLASWQIRRARGKADGKIMQPKRELAIWEAKDQNYRVLAEKIREVDLAVEEISGLDYHRFTRSVLLSQGDFAAFLRADERERSDLLERITGTAIYSQLSIAAFDRYRTEKQALENLQQQLEQLGLLTEESIDEQVLKQAQKAVLKSEKAQQKGRVQLQKFDRWHEIQHKLQQLEVEHIAAHETQLNFKEKAVQLAQSKALHPFQSDINKLLDVQKELRALIALKKQLSQAFSDHSEKEKELQETLTRQQLDINSFQKEKAAKEKDFLKADKIMDKIALLIPQQQLCIKEEKELEQVLGSEKTAKAQLKSSISSLEKKQKAQRQYLSDHKNYQDLPSQLPALEALRDQLRAAFIEKKNIESKIASENIILHEKQSQLDELWPLLKKEKAALDQLEKKYQDKLPAELSKIVGNPLKYFANKMEETEVVLQVSRELKTLEEDYSVLLNEQQIYEDRIENLALRQRSVNISILNLMEQKTHFQEELKFKKEIFRQQQLIANYEQDRMLLKEGEPCPLCLSKEHPFHQHPVEPYVDKARIEAEAAEAKNENLLQQARILMQEENELNQEIELLQGNEIKATNGRLAELRKKSAAYESKMALLLKKECIQSSEGGRHLGRKIKSLEQQLKEWKAIRSILENLHEQIVAAKVNVEKIDRALELADNEKKASNKLIEDFEKTAQLQDDKFQELTQKLNQQTQKYDYEFSLETAKANFLKFKSIAEEYQQQEKALEQTKQQLELEKIRFTHHETRLKQSEKNYEKNQSDKRSIATQLAQHQDEITLLLQGEQLDKAKLKVKTKEEQLYDGFNHTREALDNVGKKTVAVKQNITDKEEQINKLESQQSKLSNKVLKALKKLGYSSVEEAQKQLLSLEEEEALEQESIKNNKLMIEIDRALKEAKTELKKWKLSEEEQQNELSLRQAIQQMEKDYQACLLEYGQLKEKHTQQQKQKAQHALLLKSIEQQRLSFNRWAQLNDLIGQADGKKFRIFAQGLTLQKLVAIANVYLEKLNGRYFIHKKSDSDLVLEIVDTYQADNHRSIYTLSGGETFLISLALAMGLSELAGKNAQIQSLFIDEGFGTLDAQSLDLALSTLENLQSGGKTIGIISHLKALKERIGVQIEVHKQSNGFSSLSISV